MTNVLDGRNIRDQRIPELKEGFLALGFRPSLAIVQVGDQPESNAYIESKKSFAEKIGVSVSHLRLSESVYQDDLEAEIDRLNKDSSVNGVIIQFPLPEGFDSFKILEKIDPDKDVDGLHSQNLKKLLSGSNEGLVPATARGVLSLLDFYKISISGKNAVVVGRSLLVGRPTSLALINRGATVTVAHSQTQDLTLVTQKADILVVAVGSPKLIGPDHLSRGQTVIDVGINRVENEETLKLQEEISSYQLVGDVDFEAVKDLVRDISPVPGGVGPMTVLSLFENLLFACKTKESKTD